MHKDISTGHTYQSLITSHIQSINQQLKVLTWYFITSLLKSGQLYQIKINNQTHSVVLEDFLKHNPPKFN